MHHFPIDVPVLRILEEGICGPRVHEIHETKMSPAVEGDLLHFKIPGMESITNLITGEIDIVSRKSQAEPDDG